MMQADLVIIAIPGEVIRDPAGKHIATVSKSIYADKAPEVSDFEWPGDVPESGDKVHPAINAFIAKKRRIARV